MTGLVRLVTWRFSATRLAGPAGEAAPGAPPASHSIATAIAAGLVTALSAAIPGSPQLQVLAITAAALSLLGAWRDHLGEAAWAIAVVTGAAAVVAAVPASDLVFQGALPFAADRAVAGLMLAAYVDLWSRMSALDALTGTEALAISGGYILLMIAGAAGALTLGHLALALAGAAAASLIWTAPPARARIGAHGAAMLGLLTGALMLDLAANGAFAAAFILPLYMLADGLLSAARGAIKGDMPQLVNGFFHVRAARGAFSAPGVLARIAAINVVLVAAAIVSKASALQAFAAAAAAVTLLLVVFERAARED